MPLAPLLVVDDEPSILTTLQKALSLEGYAVDVAGGVKVAEEKLKKRAYDLCLVDVMLPDGDGVELLERLRATKNDTPVIMMSGHATIDTPARGARAEDPARGRGPGPPGAPAAERPPVKRLVEQIGRAAKSAASVLVTGER